jgi:hypothetical protein
LTTPPTIAEPDLLMKTLRPKSQGLLFCSTKYADAILEVGLYYTKYVIG